MIQNQNVMKSHNFKRYCINLLSQVRPNFTFLTVRNYTNNFFELSDFSVGFHVNYLNAVARSIKTLQQFSTSFRFCQGKPYSIVQLDKAKEELIESLKQSMTGFNPAYTCHGVYDKVYDANGNILAGVKLHHDQDILHLEGYRLHKRIIRAGQYPTDTRLPSTIAKDDLRELTDIGKWGQFKLTPDKFETIVVEKLKIQSGGPNV